VMVRCVQYHPLSIQAHFPLMPNEARPKRLSMIHDVMSKSLRKRHPHGIRRQYERPMLAKRHIHRIHEAMRGGSRCRNKL